MHRSSGVRSPTIDQELDSTYGEARLPLHRPLLHRMSPPAGSSAQRQLPLNQAFNKPPSTDRERSEPRRIGSSHARDNAGWLQLTHATAAYYRGAQQPGTHTPPWDTVGCSALWRTLLCVTLYDETINDENAAQVVGSRP